jgi:hypothetical protein
MTFIFTLKYCEHPAHIIMSPQSVIWPNNTLQKQDFTYPRVGLPKDMALSSGDFGKGPILFHSEAMLLRRFQIGHSPEQGFPALNRTHKMSDFTIISEPCPHFPTEGDGSAMIPRIAAHSSRGTFGNALSVNTRSNLSGAPLAG